MVLETLDLIRAHYKRSSKPYTFYLTNVFKQLNGNKKVDHQAEGAKIINMAFAAKRTVAIAA